MAVGNDSDSYGYSLSITPIGCYLEESKWILDTGATYHVCPKRKRFTSFEKLDGGLLTFDDGHTYQIEGICIVHIKLSDGTVRELKDVRYVSQLKKNFIGALEAQSLRGTHEESILKMSSGSLVILNGIRRNNLYYLKGSENLADLEHLEDDSTRLWQIRLRQVGLNSLEAFAN